MKYGEIQSEEMTIKSGVPQGSVLGPILFILYINDIQNCSKLISLVLFADDTNILHSHTCLKTLNEIIQIEMNKITDWLNANKLSINTVKTKFVLFRTKNKKINYDLKILINNENIKQVKNTTFLGIVIDEFLTWSEHKFEFFKANILCFGLSISNLRQPNLGKYIQTRIQKLVNIQKKIVRLMTFKSYFDSSEPIFKDLQILNLFKINTYLTSLFMIRYFYRKIFYV